MNSKEDNSVAISIIVATINRKIELQRLLDSLVLNIEAKFELIIVDQNEDNLIDDLILLYFKKFKIIHLKFNQKHNSAARNYGVTFANYPIICFPDDDCWYDPNVLKSVTDTFTTNQNLDLLIIKWKQNSKFKNFSTFLEKNTIYSFKGPVGYSCITLFLKKNTFIEVGKFDEQLGLGGYIGGAEETDLIFRIAKECKTIYYNNAIAVNHRFNNLSDRPYSVIRSRERGIGYLYKSYPVNIIVMLKGLLLPIVRACLSFNKGSILRNYSVLIGRVEGYIYAINKKKIKSKTS